MHILEIFIFILSFIMMGVIISKKALKLQYVVTLLGVLASVLLLHFIFEGYRWQLLSLYVAVIVLGFFVYLSIVKKLTFKKSLRTIFTAVIALFIVVSMLFAFVFPVYAMPSVSGDYLIGTESFIIESEDRYELYTDELNDLRKFKIQIWYPAELTDGFEQSAWIEDGLIASGAISRDSGFPSFALNHTVDVLSNSYSEAPISLALSSYPVILLSHGWRGIRNLHADFAEELASQGYIVVGINHSYGSVATVFSEDDVAYVNLDALPNREETPNFMEYANQLVNTYAFDIVETLDYLEVINDSENPSRFSGKFDLTKIGLLGHSTGGGADVTVALNDDRITSVMGLDAWVEAVSDTDVAKGLTIPSLFLRSGQWEVGKNNDNLYAIIENSSYAPIFYQIDGITHYDFTMVYMYSPLTKVVGFTGDIEGNYLNSILESLIVDFFDQTLKNDLDIELSSDNWDEVRTITIN